MDLNTYFDDDGKIYGYDDLKVTIILAKTGNIFTNSHNGIFNSLFCAFVFILFVLFLQITIWVSSISFHAYAEIKFQSSSDVSFNSSLNCWINPLYLHLLF